MLCLTLCLIMFLTTSCICSQVRFAPTGVPIREDVLDLGIGDRDEEHADEQDRGNAAEYIDDETYLKLMGIDRDWEIQRTRLIVTPSRLGGGEFGVVHKGIYQRKDGKKMNVAVKMLKGKMVLPW